MNNQKRLEKLLGRVTTAMKRDINFIVEEGRKGKLDAKSSRDLAAYTRLLHELSVQADKSRKDQAKEATKIPEKDLQKLARELLAESPNESEER